MGHIYCSNKVDKHYITSLIVVSLPKLHLLYVQAPDDSSPKDLKSSNRVYVVNRNR